MTRPMDMYELASVLGAHGFRVKPLLAGRARGVATLEDAVTREPIATVTSAEARELATWLETEDPLPARPERYTLCEIWAEEPRMYAIGSSSIDGYGVDEPIEIEPWSRRMLDPGPK